MIPSENYMRGDTHGGNVHGKEKLLEHLMCVWNSGGCRTTCGGDWHDYTQDQT